LLTQVKPVFSADADPLMSLRDRESNHVHFVTCDTICQRIKRRRRTRYADPARTPPTGFRRPRRRQLEPMRASVSEALKIKCCSHIRVLPDRSGSWFRGTESRCRPAILNPSGPPGASEGSMTCGGPASGLSSSARSPPALAQWSLLELSGRGGATHCQAHWISI
jgi:hypothetical protein